MPLTKPLALYLASLLAAAIATYTWGLDDWLTETLGYVGLIFLAVAYHDISC